MEADSNNSKRKTKIDIVKEYNTLLDIKQGVLDKLTSIVDEKIKLKEKINPENKVLLDKIFMLRWVMVSKTGDMSFGGESIGDTKVFDENDMITLKGKMMELIKKL
jgi:hypothetical protein